MGKLKFSILVLLVFLAFSTSVFCQSSSSITTGKLFEEMIDLEGLTRFPSPTYRMVQYSSYDHRSTLPGGPDWFANADGFGGEPIPNFEKVLTEPNESGIGEYLMVDKKGPGAIVRLWTARINGNLRVYIDDMTTPFYEGEADSFFRHPYDSFNEMDVVNRERFIRTIYQRDASYAPIPFEKRIRIEWIGDLQKLHFYQIQLRLYNRNAKIISFQPEDINTYKNIIDEVTMALADPDKYLPIKSSKKSQNFNINIPVGQKSKVIQLYGPGAIEKIILLLKADNMDYALRQTVLHINCDGYPWGQVQSPLGDFFGAAPGVNPFQSLPFSTAADGTMTSRFVMPFKDSVQIFFENHGKEDVVIEGEVLPMDYNWNENSMHFRARWRVNHNIVASNSDVQDLPFLLAQGTGIYVGTTSYLLNPSSVPTPWGNWWGEGDEKIFVDDDIHPSLFGTGSEDYYNYSWSSPDIFHFPYCGQPRNDGPGNRGFVTNYRWHILDPIPFSNNIQFYMELFSHLPTPGFSYARIGYHYAKPGIRDDHQVIMEEDLRIIDLPMDWEPEAKLAAQNSEFFQAESILAKNKNSKLKKGDLWAGGQVLVWNPQNIGERIDFNIKVAKEGQKRIYITAALTPLSGKIRIYLNDKPINNKDLVIDLNRPYRTLLRNFSFEPLELKTGQHKLSIEFVGADVEIKSPEIGIDFIWIKNL